MESKHVWGGGVFGAGWAITGACPGTASTALGAGSLMGGVLLVGIVAGIGFRDLVTTRTTPMAATSAAADLSLEAAAVRQ